MSKRPDFAHPRNVVADTVSARDLSCCYDTSKIQRNVSVYVSSQSGDDTANNGRSASSPVETFEKAIDILNRIAAWEGEATIRLMDTVTVTGTSSVAGPAGVQVLRPKVGQARSVKVTGYAPTLTTFRITNGTSPAPAPPTGFANFPLWLQVTVSSTMTAATHARKRFTITHPTTGEIATDGVIYTNAMSSFQLMHEVGIDYTGYDLNVIEPDTGISPPKLALTGAATGDTYYLDGDIPLVFSDVGMQTDYAGFASHDPGYNVTFERVQWEIGVNSSAVNNERFTVRSSYIFSTTSGTRQSFVAGPCDRFDVERCWMHDVRIAVGSATPYGWADGSPVRFEIHASLFDGVSNCYFAGQGRIVGTAFLNGYASSPTTQTTGNVFYWNCGMSGTDQASTAMSYTSDARSTMVNCELVNSLGGVNPVLEIDNSTVHFVGLMYIMTAQNGGAASNHLIDVTRGGSLVTVDAPITFAVDANVAATAELTVDTGSTCSVGSSAAIFGAGPTAIDWVDGGGPVAFPVVAGWHQNGSCRVATF